MVCHLFTYGASNVGPPNAVRNNIASAGNLYLNSTPATKFYFDPTLQAISEFTARYQLIMCLGLTNIKSYSNVTYYALWFQLRRHSGISLFPASTPKMALKKKVVSIGEERLNKFITNSNEQVKFQVPDEIKLCLDCRQEFVNN